MICLHVTLSRLYSMPVYTLGRLGMFGLVLMVITTKFTGVVQGWAVIIMGLLSGSVPWHTMMVLHKKIWFLKQVDDTMAVFHTHAVAGSLGGLLAGFFSDPKLNRMFYNIEPSSDLYRTCLWDS